MYKLCPAELDGTPEWVLRLSDNALVRIADDNPHYQAYLAWVAEGNTPEPAEEVTGG
jgi:hypothetical protein